MLKLLAPALFLGLFAFLAGCGFISEQIGYKSPSLIAEDTTPPEIVFTSPTASKTTSVPVYTFEWAVAENGSGLDKVEYALFGAANCTGPALESGSVSGGAVSLQLAPASLNSLQIRAVDKQGNRSTEKCSREIRPKGVGLVANLETRQDSYVKNQILLGQKILFASFQSHLGAELWVSDGTPQGTQLLLDIRPGPESSSPQFFVHHQDEVYFLANDGTHGQELWKTDGTMDGTTRVSDAVSGVGSVGAESLSSVNGRLIFLRTDSVYGQELWFYSADYSSIQVLDINSGAASSSPEYFTLAGSVVFFAATTAANGKELWKSDGTPAGTSLVRDILVGAGPGLSWTPTKAPVWTGTKLLFQAYDAVGGTELWESDGTLAGTNRLVDFNPGVGSSQIRHLTMASGKVYFTVNSPSYYQDFFISDGTSGGTQLLKDITTDSGGDLYFSVTPFQSGIVFFVLTPSGMELWKSDGTSAGTVSVKVVNSSAGVFDSPPGSIQVLGEKFYFSANDGIHGHELWESDGTSTGTRMVADIRAGLLSSNPDQILLLDGALFFVASDEDSVLHLWKLSQGSNQPQKIRSVRTPTFGIGTLAKEITAGQHSFLFGNSSYTNILAKFDENNDLRLKYSFDYDPCSSAQPKAAHGKVLFFDNSSVKAFDPETDQTTVVGTWELDQVWESFIQIGVQLFTIVFDPADSYGKELRRVNPDGSLTLVKDAHPSSSGAYSPVPFGNKIFFNGNNSTAGYEPWISDGTEAGTFQLRDVRSGSQASSPSFWAQTSSYLFFRANDGSKESLWRTDGTTGGTQKVVDFMNSNYSFPYSVVAQGTKVFYGGPRNGTTNYGSEGVELYVIDGTGPAQLVVDIVPGSGSSFPTDLTVLGSKVVFRATTPALGWELWVSDGTAGGTFVLADIAAGAGHSSPTILGAFDGVLYFSANDGVSGIELWRTDGTTAGTFRLKDINPSGSSSPSEMAKVGGMIYFAADDGVHGKEFWKTDGTGAGTVMVADINPGLPGSDPAGFFQRDDLVFFVANDGFNGREVHRYLP